MDADHADLAPCEPRVLGFQGRNFDNLASFSQALKHPKNPWRFNVPQNATELVRKLESAQNCSALPEGSLPCEDGVYSKAGGVHATLPRNSQSSA